MAHDSEFLDYEPLTRSRAVQKTSRADAFSPAPQSGPDRRLQEPSVSSDKSREGLISATPARRSPRANWILKRGHSISFAGLFLFTAVLYFRPYELIGALSSLTSMAFWIAFPTLLIFFPSQLLLEGNLTARPREVNLILILILLALLSIPFAVNPGEAWDTFLNKEFIRAVLMFIVIVNVVRTERRLQALMLLALAVSLFLSFNAFRDFRAGLFSFEGYRVKGAIGGMFDNPNDMSLHLVTMIPIAMGLLFATKNYVLKAVCLVTSILMVVAIVVTYSRGGFIGLMAIAGAFAWKFGRRRPIIVLLLAIIGIAIFLSFAPGNYIVRISSILDASLDPNGSSSARSELFKRSVVVALANPIFGVGMGNFHILSIREAVTHNAYTQVAAEMGFAASVVYTMFIVAGLRRVQKIEKDSLGKDSLSKFHYLSIGLQVSIIGYMVGSFFASVAYLFYIYYLVGYAVSLSRLYVLKSDPPMLRPGSTL